MNNLCMCLCLHLSVSFETDLWEVTNGESETLFVEDGKVPTKLVRKWQERVRLGHGLRLDRSEKRTIEMKFQTREQASVVLPFHQLVSLWSSIRMRSPRFNSISPSSCGTKSKAATYICGSLAGIDGSNDGWTWEFCIVRWGAPLD